MTPRLKATVATAALHLALLLDPVAVSAEVTYSHANHRAGSGHSRHPAGRSHKHAGTGTIERRGSQYRSRGRAGDAPYASRSAAGTDARTADDNPRSRDHTHAGEGRDDGVRSYSRRDAQQRSYDNTSRRRDWRADRGERDDYVGRDIRRGDPGAYRGDHGSRDWRGYGDERYGIRRGYGLSSHRQPYRGPSSSAFGARRFDHRGGNGDGSFRYSPDPGRDIYQQPHPPRDSRSVPGYGYGYGNPPQFDHPSLQRGPSVPQPLRRYPRRH